ncbi:macrophage colony-stimulating factor 1 receptor [Rhinophrynus dorsalis]
MSVDVPSVIQANIFSPEEPEEMVACCGASAALEALWQGLGTPIIQPSGKELIFLSGERITLTCSGISTVKWDKKGLKRNSVTQNGNSAVLDIKKAKYTDTGTYNCVYNNSDHFGSASVHLFVKDTSKYWNVISGNVRVNEYTDALMPCLITDPSVNMSEVSLKLLESSSKNQANVISFDAKKGFTIHNVQISNEGSYVCQAIVNGERKVSDNIRLTVNEVARAPPSLTMDSGNHVRIQGESFQITCIASSTVTSEIKWVHPAEKFTDTTDLTYTLPEWKTISTLSILRLKLNDSGNYTCIGQVGKLQNTVSTFLQVVEKGYMHLSTSQNSSITLNVGESIELMVQIEAYPTQLSWKWVHNNPDNTNDVSSQGRMWSTGRYRNVSTLALNRIKESEGGTYTFFASNSKANASLTFKIILYRRPTVEITSTTFNNSRRILCTAWGNPLPSIRWFRCSEEGCRDNGTNYLTGERTRFLETEVESVLIMDEHSNNTSIGCMAKNSVGTDSKEVVLSNNFLTVTQQITHKLFQPLLLGSILIGVLFFLLFVFSFYKYRQKPKYDVRWQIIQHTEGNNYICIDPTQLPYNDKWEFPRANLHFGKTLGAGAFGKVMEATAFGLGKDDSALRVAVKMLKPSAHTDEVEALMSELKILSHLGNHQNIVNLLGACTAGGPILVITEYCHYGDLLNFLRKKAEAMNEMFTISLEENSGSSDYKNMSMEEKYIRSDSGFASKSADSYIEMRPVASNSNSGDSLKDEEDTDDNLPLDLYDLLNFSLQVAQGMSFLASKNCIHRDVAARNVLVTHGRVAKICDFGLARDIENDSNYVVKGNARLPVKWMAPESIFDCIYTAQSDVWSYGILLWEIFSLGRSPYPGIMVNRKFYKMVKEGYKMDCPDYAPLEIYRIMKTCWDLEPTRRPTFNQISGLINKQMNLINEKDYANISHAQENQEHVDTKCEIQQPLIKGNNYQFC